MPSKNRQTAEVLNSRGTAATSNIGTGANDVPTNADVRNPRNRIINPTMTISQENGFATGFAGVDTNFYVSDEVFTNTSSASNGGIQKSYQTLEGERSVRLLVTTATTNLSGGNAAGTFGVKLEKANLSQLDDGDVAVSFKCRTNWAGKLSLSFRNGSNTKYYVTDIDVVSGINQVFKVIPFETNTVSSQTLEDGKGLVMNIGFNNEGSLQHTASNNDTWISGVAYCSDESTQWTKTLGNYLEITNRDLYSGNVPREFQPNSYAYDLAECQRYGFLIPKGTIAQVYNNTSVIFFVEKNFRTTGLVINALIAGAIVWDDLPAITTRTSTSTPNKYSTSEGGVSIVLSGFSGLTIGRFLVLISSDAYFVNARL